MVFTSCASLKDLEENEYLLYKQSIKGNKKVPVKDTREDKKRKNKEEKEIKKEEKG